MAAPKPGGFKMSLGALKAKPGLKASPAQKDNKKSKPLLGDDEPDDSVKQQEITGWDAEGGAVEANGKKEKEQLRVIPVPPNRDWRAAARRKHLAKAPHQQAQNETVDEKQIEEPKYQYGLTVMKKDEAQEDSSAEPDAPEPMEVEQDNLTEQERLEKKALDALITGKSTDNDLVIPVQTEEEAFQNDLENAPEAPTLEAYEATPIEGFGAALLRGMGWKDGEGIGKNGSSVKPKEIKRRPALLGLGAKEEAAVGIELGEWGGGKGKGKGKKVAQSYNPVMLRNKNTGEVITEEELKAKLESQKLVEEEKASKPKSKYDDGEDGEDERRREKRREKRDDRDRDRRREDDYDSERRRDKDRRGDKDDYYDDDRRRDKRQERTRDDDSERRREKRRERSRSPDDRKDKRRDRNRYRSRSRDAKGRSDRRDRSRSHDSDERRKRRRDREYDDDERSERKKKYRDDKYYR
jgi:hypothetical protein